MVAKGWVPPFLNAVGEYMLRQKAYLVAIMADGRLSCKACGRFLRGNLDEHHQAHMQELDDYNFEQDKQRKIARKIAKGPQQEESSVQNTEKAGGKAGEFYPNPCESCGEAISRTGKPGRPPKMHDACKGISSELSPKEQAIAAELGL